jgi:exonuclease VII large subunit
LSLELSKTIDMSNDAVYSAGKHIKKYKRRINDTIDKMEDILEKETYSERKEVERALQKLQTKVAEVKEQKSYKSFEKDLHALESKLNITMEKVFEQYSRCIRKICECYPDPKIRSQQLNEFHEVLGDAFLTKDERKIISLIKSRISQMPTTGQKMLEL